MDTMSKRSVLLVLTITVLSMLFVCSAQATAPTNQEDTTQESATAESQTDAWLRPEDLPEGTMCLRELNEAEQNVVDVLCGTHYGYNTAMFPFHVGEDCTSVKLWSEVYKNGELVFKDYYAEHELDGNTGEIGVTIYSPVKNSLSIYQSNGGGIGTFILPVETPDWNGESCFTNTRVRAGEQTVALDTPYNLMVYAQNDEWFPSDALSTYVEGKEGMEDFPYMVLIRCEFNSSLSQNNQLDS